MKRIRFLAGVALLFFCLASLPLTLAAEETGSGAEQPAGLAFKWVHFFVVAGAFLYLARRYGRPHFYRQADIISAAITKATAARTEAERQLQQAADKIAGLEQEIAEFRAAAQREARAEYERLRTLMRADAQKVGAAAKAEIEAAERTAHVELKKLAAKLAIDRAEKIVSKQMTPALQESLVQNFVATLQERPN